MIWTVKGIIQKLLQLQIVVVSDTAVREVAAVDMGEADHTVMKVGEWARLGVLGEGIVQRVQKKLAGKMLLSFWQQAGQRDLHDAVLALNPNIQHGACRGEIFLLSRTCRCINQMTQTAGKLLCAESGVHGESLVVFRVSLYVRHVHGIERVGQPGQFIEN